MKTSLLSSIPRLGTLLGVLCAFALATPASAQVDNLLPEGAFPGQPGGRVRGWTVPHENHLQRIGASITLWAPEEGSPNNILRFQNSNKQHHATIQSSLEVSPSWIGRTVVVRAQMRAVNLDVGKEGWHNARVIISMEHRDGRRSFPGALFLDFDSSSWRTLTSRIRIPEDAVSLNFNVGLFHCIGLMDIRDLTVTLE
jgi:hypothetical protein